MKDLVKLLYRFKIKVMFYFGLGFAEVNNTLSLVKDIIIVLGYGVLALHIHLNLWATVGICVLAFFSFLLLGFILKQSGLSDYQTKLTNSINPEVKLIPDIIKRLERIENGLGQSTRVRVKVVGKLR